MDSLTNERRLLEEMADKAISQEKSLGEADEVLAHSQLVDTLVIQSMKICEEKDTAKK